MMRTHRGRDAVRRRILKHRIQPPGPHLREYAFRIHGQDGETHMQVHLRDTAAISAARTLAAGRGFEVWRDDLCVYAGSAPTRN